MYLSELIVLSEVDNKVKLQPVSANEAGSNRLLLIRKSNEMQSKFDLDYMYFDYINAEGFEGLEAMLLLG